MADKIEEGTQRFGQSVKHLVSRKLPIYAGKTAQQHFRENFTKGDFVNGGGTEWQPIFIGTNAVGHKTKKKTTPRKGCRLVNSLGLEGRSPREDTAEK